MERWSRDDAARITGHRMASRGVTGHHRRRWHVSQKSIIVTTAPIIDQWNTAPRSIDRSIGRSIDRSIRCPRARARPVDYDGATVITAVTASARYDNYYDEMRGDGGGGLLPWPPPPPGPGPGASGGPTLQHEAHAAAASFAHGGGGGFGGFGGGVGANRARLDSGYCNVM